MGKKKLEVAFSGYTLSAYEKFTGKIPGVTKARELKVGDVLNLYYLDAPEPILAMVVEGAPSSKEGDLSDIKVIHIDMMGKRNAITSLNTDKWEKLGRKKIQITFL